MVFTGYLIEFYSPTSEKMKRSDYGQGYHYLFKIKKNEGKKRFIATKKNCFPKCCRVLTGKPSSEDFEELDIGFSSKRT